MTLRQLLDKCVLRLLRSRFFDRVVGYLSYQRRRKTRREVEQRLRLQGGYPCEVLRGPFKGMRLPDPDCYIDSRFEKVFGAYEHELFPVIAGLTAESPQLNQVIVLGASDGFYAVGLARLLPQASVIAFETRATKREVLAAAADLNGVSERVTLQGMATPDSLQTFLRQGYGLVFCDVDGYEKELLDPQQAPELRHTCILVETHDCFVPGIAELLKNRFTSSHTIKEIHMSGPDFKGLPELAGLRMHEVEALVGSERPMLQTWLWMTPHQPRTP